MEKEYDENMQRERETDKEREKEIIIDICNKERYILIIYIYAIRKGEVETSKKA